MKKLIMITIALAFAGQAAALKYPDAGPDFTGCDNSGWVVWEFIDDGCLPTSDEFDPPYDYNPGPAVEPPTFGSRHWDDPIDDSGWGCSYGEDCWTWEDGAFTVLSEDSFNQSIPHRSEKLFLRQYFQVVHTMPALDPGDLEDLGLIGLGLELWDMSVNGWTGCPAGYEGLDGDGYLGGGNEFPTPDVSYEIPDSNGWFTSMWITDFWQDVEATTGYAAVESIDLDLATHAVCIVGMDFDAPAENFQIEEVILDFIWFNEADGSDIPLIPCTCRCPPPPPIIIVPVVVYEPQDAGGPPPMGPVSDDIMVKLGWRPGDGLDYPNFNCEVMVDPDPNQENVGSADFSFTNPVPPDPNGNVTLTFTQDNWDIYQDITVTATADVLREGNEAFHLEFTVTIDIADSNFGYGEPITQRKGIIVVDNDIPFISALPYGALEDVLTENNPGVPACVNVTLSHQPTDNVEILVARESDFEILLESMSVMDPNHLLFTPGNYNVNQQICLEARDDDELAEAWLEWIDGVVILNGFSDDIRYQSADEGGELDEVVVNFNVQDNDCGTWGYMHVDVNEDCYVNLGDVALLYTQWLMCAQPYGDGCDKIWDLLPPEE